MYQLVTVSSNTCSQIHVQIKHSLTHLQDLIPTLAGVFTYIFYINQKEGLNVVDVLENVLFVHAFGQLHVIELTVTGWYIIQYSSTITSFS